VHNFTAVTDVCSQLTILHFSRILPLPHLSLFSHAVESMAGSQSCSAGKLQTYFQAVNITFKLNLAMDITVLGHWKSHIIWMIVRNTLYHSPQLPGCWCKVFIWNSGALWDHEHWILLSG